MLILLINYLIFCVIYFYRIICFKKVSVSSHLRENFGKVILKIQRNFSCLESKSFNPIFFSNITEQKWQTFLNYDKNISIFTQDACCTF